MANLNFSFRRTPRLNGFILCVVVAMICLAYGRWRGRLPDWWEAHGGGIPYVIFWIAAWFVWFPKPRAILPITVGVVAFTCFLEFLQLWQPAWLVQFRATKFGAALLGSGFDWQDFPPYWIGGLVGFGLLKLCWRHGSCTAMNSQEEQD